MRRISLQRACLTLTACNTAVLVFELSNNEVLRRLAPSLWEAPLSGLPLGSWEFIAIIIFTVLFYVSVAVCCVALVIAAARTRHSLPVAMRGRIWLSVANIIVVVIGTITPHLTRG